MKSPFKVMSTAALAAAVAVPTLSVPAADAAETSSFHSVALETEDGSVKTVPFMEYAKAKTFGTGELGAFVEASSVVAVSAEEGKFVSVRTLALAKIEDTDADTASLLADLDDSEDNLVAEEDVAEYTEFGEPEVVAPAVESVSANNLREITVEFNTALDAEALAGTSNYTVNGTVNPASVTVAEDQKSVSILLSEANKLSNYSKDNKLVISKSVGFEEDVTIESIAASDSTVPQAVGAEVVGPRSIQVTFSEPLDDTTTKSNTVSAFELDNGTVALDTTYAAYSGKTVTLKTLSDLEEGSHSLSLSANSNVEDSAGYPAEPATLSFEAVKDTTAPTAELTSSTETTATVKFSKPVSNVSGNSNVLFRHTYNTATNEVAGDSVNVTNPSGDNQTFVVDFGTSNPFPPGETALFVEYADDSSTKIQDNYGNAYEETTFTVSTEADNTKPAVSNVEFVNSSTVKVVFSENVDATTAQDSSNYTFKDSAGDELAVTNAAFDGSSKNTVLLTTATINGGTHTLEVKNVEDRSIAENVIDTVTKSFSATDKVAPTVEDVDSSTPSTVDVQQVGDKKVKVSFSEIMDTTTTTDKSNWKYDSVALPSDATVTATDSGKAVILTFPASVVDTKDLTLARVQDAAGNWSEAFEQTLNIKALSELTPSSVEMTSKNTVELTFENQVVSGATTADFKVSEDGGTNYGNIAVTGVSTNVSDGDTTITLVLGSDLPNTTASGIQVQTYDGTTGGNATVNAENEFGTALKFTNVAASDATAPTMDSSAIADNGGTAGSFDTVTVTFSENIYPYSVSDSDFSVEGYTVSGVNNVSGSTVELSLVENADNLSSPTVTLTGEVEDTDGNVLEGEVSVDTPSTDITAPAQVTNLTGNTADTDTEAAGGVENTLSWDASTESDFDHYVVKRYTDSGLTANETVIDNNLTTNSVTDSSATASTTYYYSVEAVDTSSNASTAASVQVNTTADTDNAPDTVTSITAADANAGTAGGTLIDYSFDANTNSDFDRYEVYVVANDTTAQSTYSEIKTNNTVTENLSAQGTTTVSDQIDALSTGDYNVYVFVVDSAGNVSAVPTAGNVVLN